MSRPLKLLARDDEDLQVLAGYLQDAIVPVSETCFLRDEHRFVMVVNRFRWETAERPEVVEPQGDAAFEDGAPARCYERVNCGICFDGIDAVRMRGLDLHERGRMLCLLTLAAEDGAVVMHFSGGACIRLEGARWCCRV
ncbi:MAG TPA: DUF2948 family protein, partial [Arenibaculum sp.]|nr:DUF2948 family protein [Arenibaculum sp.]